MEKQSIRAIVERLQNSEPIQYVLGEMEFYGLPFEVSPAVLIPRPETEELVRLIIRSNEASDAPKLTNILDIGTGSGCIAITLAKNLPESKVYALDISEEALQTARRNAQRNEAVVHFFQADILSVTMLQKTPVLPQFELIVSNPPYVKNIEKAAMKPNVLNYEPSQALFVPDDDPILFYDRIAGLALEKLTENGLLYFEINALHGDMICRMLDKKRFHNITLLHDLSGKERFIKASL